MELVNLKKLISNFYSTKSMCDNYKKESDKLNKQIKKEMSDLQMDTVELEDEGLVCELKVNERKSFKENELIRYLKNLKEPILGIIETVEKVNEDALENAIYNGLISASDLNPFVTVKPVQVLKVKKK